MVDFSNKLAIEEMASTQEDRSPTFNAAIARLEVMALGCSAEDILLDTPPGSPAEGDVYVLGTSPTGAWSGHALDITYYYNGAWEFIDPYDGLIAYAKNEDKYYRYKTGYGWETLINPSALVAIEQTDFFSAQIEIGKDKTYYFAINSPIELTIHSITTRAFSGGSGTFTFDINGTPLGGSINAVSNSEVTEIHSSDNVLPVGGDLKGVLSCDSPAPSDLSVMIYYTYNLASA